MKTIYLIIPNKALRRGDIVQKTDIQVVSLDDELVLDLVSLKGRRPKRGAHSPPDFY